MLSYLTGFFASLSLRSNLSFKDIYKEESFLLDCVFKVALIFVDCLLSTGGRVKYWFGRQVSLDFNEGFFLVWT